MTPLLALSLSLVAGLATGIGGIVSVLGGGTSRRFLAGALGFSAGVMLCLSAVELIPAAVADLAEDGLSPWWAWVAVAAGAALVIAFSVLVRVGHRLRRAASAAQQTDAGSHVSPAQRRMLLRTGLLTAIAITIHNFPEGFATFLAALSDPALALPVVAAIALHNVPEGIAVAVPIYHATGSRLRALLVSFGSGLAEPAGAVIGWLILAPFLTPAVLSTVLAGVAGIMIMICVLELLPTAFAQRFRVTAVMGIIAGAAIMQISLVLLA